MAITPGSVKFVDEAGNELDVRPAPPLYALDAPPPPPLSDALVDAWFAETFHNLALPTDLYSRFYAAKERLKAQLRGEG